MASKAEIATSPPICYNSLMVRNAKLLQQFETNLLASEALDISKNYRIFESMRQYARSVGALPGPNPLEGLEVNITLSKKLRHVRSSN